MCYDCKQELPLDQFGKNKAQDDGHAIYCIECARKRQQASRDRLANGERRRSYIPKTEVGGEVLGRTTPERPLAGVPIAEIAAELKARGYSFRIVQEIVVEG